MVITPLQTSIIHFIISINSDKERTSESSNARNSAGNVAVGCGDSLFCSLLSSCGWGLVAGSFEQVGAGSESGVWSALVPGISGRVLESAGSFETVGSGSESGVWSILLLDICGHVLVWGLVAGSFKTVGTGSESGVWSTLLPDICGHVLVSGLVAGSFKTVGTGSESGVWSALLPDICGRVLESELVAKTVVHWSYTAVIFWTTSGQLSDRSKVSPAVM